jgi:hypothetical protein
VVDVFYYNGPLRRGLDLRLIEFISANQKAKELLLVLTTPGGEPDAAYKIGRYIQSKYENFVLFIPGLCKSAGTLLAIAANELAFSPYGELGPLDIQMARTDYLAGMESGLNISEAFLTLESRAKENFHSIVNEIVAGSGGIISFQTASHSAAEIVKALYSPIFSRIDPEDVGSRARAMRIGAEYGERLNKKYDNLKKDALKALSEDYTNHGFVIDIQEATLLFNRVREANKVEKGLVKLLGNSCRFTRQDDEPKIVNLTEPYKTAITASSTAEADKNVPKAKSTRKTAKLRAVANARAKSNGRDTKAPG